MIETIVKTNSGSISVALFGQSDYRINGFPITIKPFELPSTSGDSKIPATTLVKIFRKHLVYPAGSVKDAWPLELQEMVETILFLMACRDFRIRTGDSFFYSATAGFSLRRLELINIKTWSGFCKMAFRF